jgi:flagellar biosynthesis GTPase FlhF
MSLLIQINTTQTAVLSKLQKQFNSSIQKIDKLKAELIHTKVEIDKIKVKISGDIIPLERKLMNIQVQEIIALDQVFQANSLKKRDNATLSEIIHERSYSMIDQLDIEELKPIFERHNDGQSFEDIDKEADEMTSEILKSSFGQMFGIDFEEDADISSPEKMQEYIDQKMAEKEAEEANNYANKKKTTKQIEREEKQKQEEKNLNKTSRQIYMELVKEFHPDRERNELERERKTLLMHRITEAYEKDDLFDLLRLRLELLGTDLEHSNDEQLKYYVKLLKQQVAELESEIYDLQAFGQTSMFGASLYQRFASDGYTTMESKFKREISQLKRNIKKEEENLPFYSQPAQVKFMIDDYRKEQKRQNRVGGNDLEDIFRMMGI